MNIQVGRMNDACIIQIHLSSTFKIPLFVLVVAPTGYITATYQFFIEICLISELLRFLSLPIEMLPKNRM